MADAKAVNAGLALIDGLKPENELEAMLIAQMAATHGLAMKYSARLYNGTITTIAEQDSTALTLCRLQRAFTTQIELAVEHAARWPAEGRGRTRARLPRRSSDRRRRNPCREGDIR